MRTRLNLFQHAFKAHKDNEPDGTVYGTQAEAEKAAGDVAREALSDHFESEETDDIIESLAEALGEDHPQLDALREALDARAVGASPEKALELLSDADAVEAADSLLHDFESAIYPVSVELDTLALLRAVSGEQSPSAAALLETGAVLALRAVNRWESGDLAGAVNALQEWAGDVQDAFPGLDYSDDEDEGDEEGED